MKILWGIDLGGTKIEGVILEVGKNNFNVLHRIRIPTEAQFGYEHILSQIQKLVERLVAESNLEPTKIGIGTPGTLDPILNTIKNSNSTALNGKHLKRDLEQRLNIPLSMANDANCFTLAEARLGIVPEEMPEAKLVFGVIMGTGVGGGIVCNGEVMGGRQGICGEWGHNFLDESGGPCYCGKNGCVERNISGPALEKYYFSKSGKQIKLKQIVEVYRTGNDPFAIDTMQRLFQMFGKGISVVINILDPDVIVLGGGLGNIDELYIEGVKYIDEYIFNNRMETVFLKPKLGDSAGVFGAALL